jgi:hypothetical protein
MIDVHKIQKIIQLLDPDPLRDACNSLFAVQWLLNAKFTKSKVKSKAIPVTGRGGL